MTEAFGLEIGKPRPLRVIMRDTDLQRSSRIRPMSSGERTRAWLGRCRRLSKDYEATIESSEAFDKLAMIHLMARWLVRTLGFWTRSQGDLGFLAVLGAAAVQDHDGRVLVEVKIADHEAGAYQDPDQPAGCWTKAQFSPVTTGPRNGGRPAGAWPKREISK